MIARVEPRVGALTGCDSCATRAPRLCEPPRWTKVVSRGDAALPNNERLHILVQELRLALGDSQTSRPGVYDANGNEAWFIRVFVWCPRSLCGVWCGGGDVGVGDRFPLMKPQPWARPLFVLHCPVAQVVAPQGPVVR